MINNKTKFNAAKVTAIFELPNFFVQNFQFLALLLPFWADLRTKYYNFAVQNLVQHGSIQLSCQTRFLRQKIEY